MSLEPFIALFTDKQTLHAELPEESVFIFTVDALELWKLNFFTSICFFIVVTHCVMNFYGEVKHLPWRVPASVELERNTRIGHTSILSQKNLAFRGLGKEHWECVTETQIQRLLPFIFPPSCCFPVPLKDHFGIVIISFDYAFKLVMILLISLLILGGSRFLNMQRQFYVYPFFL